MADGERQACQGSTALAISDQLCPQPSRYTTPE